jgi:drug/metabolite transporter (DMT)-like permease
MLCGALSALIMSFPDEKTIFYGIGYAIVGVILYSSSVVLTKKCAEDGPFRTLFFYAFLSVLPCFVACELTLKAQGAIILYFLGQAFLHMAAFFTFVKALSLGDLSRVSFLEYSDILWATLLGHLFFGEKPTLLFWLAAFILIMGKIIYFWRIKNNE